MKRPFDAKRFWEFLRDWKFCVPFCLAVTAALVWIGVVLWRRWTMVALILGVIIGILTFKGCGNWGDNA